MLLIVLRVGLRVLHGRMRWLTLTAAVIFFICCFGMSSYSRRLERRLNQHRAGEF